LVPLPAELTFTHIFGWTPGGAKNILSRLSHLSPKELENGVLKTNELRAVGSSSFSAMTRPTGPVAPMSHFGVVSWSVDLMVKRLEENIGNRFKG
jgi:hypothetical protein